MKEQRSWFVVATVDGRDLDWWQYENEQDAIRESGKHPGSYIVSFVRGGWIPVYRCDHGV